jgi:hypothetical protein
LADVDALEDATPAFHWCWELRSFTGLPKAVKQHADAARKHRKQVRVLLECLRRWRSRTPFHMCADCTCYSTGLILGCGLLHDIYTLLQVLDRLKAASAYVQLAQSLTKINKTAEAKLARAAAKVGKVPPLASLQAQLQAAVEAAEQLCSTVKVRDADSNNM